MAMLTKNAVAKALTATHGNVSAAARALGVSRRAIGKRIDADPALKQAVIDARETILDDAERSLADAVKAGAPWAVVFVLKTQGRGRGYVERREQGVELSGPGGAPIQTETTVVHVDLSVKLAEFAGAIRAAALSNVLETVKPALQAPPVLVTRLKT